MAHHSFANENKDCNETPGMRLRGLRSPDSGRLTGSLEQPTGAFVFIGLFLALLGFSLWLGVFAYNILWIGKL